MAERGRACRLGYRPVADAAGQVDEGGDFGCAGPRDSHRCSAVGASRGQLLIDCKKDVARSTTLGRMPITKENAIEAYGKPGGTS